MNKILDIITAKMQQAFVDAGYDASFGRVTVSNRPDLCEYQCNGALAAAKTYKCAPLVPPRFNQRGVTQSRVSMMRGVGFVFNNLILGCTGSSLLCLRSLSLQGVEAPL